MTRRAYLRYSRRVRVIGLSVAVAGSIASATATGCVRDPAPAECPDVNVGNLVVTEVRGEQSPSDGNGPWIELYNASSTTIDLEGTKIRFRNATGSTETPVLVRRSLPVAAGAYVVLGLVDDANRPSHIDYGFLQDYHVGFLAGGAVDIEACGERIERIQYGGLPRTGTYSFGTTPPDADSNDLPAMWCTNAASDGTPKQANPPCP
jgi:hypothetical protein